MEFPYIGGPNIEHTMLLPFLEGAPPKRDPCLLESVAHILCSSSEGIATFFRPPTHFSSLRLCFVKLPCNGHEGPLRYMVLKETTKGPEKDNFDKLLLSAPKNFRFGVGMDRPGGLGFEWMLVYIPLRLQKLPSLTRTTSNGPGRNYLTECLHAQI